jgi:hypothetical protein
MHQVTRNNFPELLSSTAKKSIIFRIIYSVRPSLQMEALQNTQVFFKFRVMMPRCTDVSEENITSVLK